VLKNGKLNKKAISGKGIYALCRGSKYYYRIEDIKVTCMETFIPDPNMFRMWVIFLNM
jgi:hypothetical protein